METFKDLVLDEERALYNKKDIDVINCKFDGPKDGVSALKECEDIHVRDCYFNLRYPFWHTKKAALENCELTENCRAAFWYCKYSLVNYSKLNGIKAFRECKYTAIANSEIDSKEFGWRCNRFNLRDCKINSEYFGFETDYIYCENINFTGKYSFQYCNNV